MGFATLIIIEIIYAVISITSIYTVDDNHRYGATFPASRLIILQDVSYEILQMRYGVSRAMLNMGDDALIDGVIEELHNVHYSLLEHLESYEMLVTTDPRMTVAEQNEHFQAAEALTNFIEEYVNMIALPGLDAARVIDTELINQLFSRGDDLHANITNTYSLMMSIAQNAMEGTLIETNQLVSNIITIIIVAVGLSILISLLLAYFLPIAISRPIHEVVQAIKEITKGNFNVNLRTDGNDEPAELARSAKQLVEMINTLMQDLNFMSDEHKRGEIDHFVDVNKYSGEYKTLVKQINFMVSDQLVVMNKSLTVINNIARGDLENAELERFPLKKAIINETVDLLLENLTDVSNGVQGMIKAAAEDGDLAYHIDESLFTNYGAWLELVKGLNQVCKSVDAPVVEIRDVITALGQGRFDKKIVGNYNGDFLSIKTNMNNTVDRLSSYMNEMNRTLGAIAGGDLTTSINGEFLGEFSTIKNSIEHIITTLHKTLSEINSSSEQVLAGAKQISMSSMDMANGATQQASSVQELNATMDVISHQTNQNADSAEGANAISTRSTENAMEGNAAMKQMLEAMLQIKESSNNISQIIKVIQDIAFQTNLLSLNAAVEAARAGEHGRGFSVVAEEVRNLAARSQTAATETTTLIEDSIGRVEIGSEIAESTSESLDTIVQNANELLNITNGISTSSREQAEAIQQVSSGLSQISQVVQSNSAVSEETAAAAEQLNSQAELLKQLVSYFKL